MNQNSHPDTGAPSATAAPGGSGADGAGQEQQSLVEQLQAQAADYEDRWRRALAEVENTRKRDARDLQRRVADERARVAAAWLPVVDSLEMALQHAQANPGSIIGGVQAVREQALAVLSQLGFPRRQDEGSRFDPSRHEAVSTVRTDHVAPGAVLQVLRPGYGSDDQMLRPASVIVAAEVDDGEQS